jgi:hypothetical protein
MLIAVIAAALVLSQLDLHASVRKMAAPGKFSTSRNYREGK